MSANNSIRGKLLTYALVGRGLQGSKDPIAALMPFFRPIAEDNKGQGFAPDKFKREMFERYDLKLTRDLTEIFVQRLIALGLLEKIGPRSGLIWVSSRNAPSNDPGETNQKLDQLLKLARVFQTERTNLFAPEFDEDQFLDALLSVLLDQNSALQSAINAMPGADAHSKAKSEKQQFTENEYAASEFVGWLRTKNEDLFAWVADLAGAACVSEALMEIRTPKPNEQFRPDATFYLDTPFLMEFLGLSGQAAREDAKFIVDSLKSQRFPVAVLPQSINELQRNIRGVLKATPTQRVGPSAAALLRQEVTEDYLNSVLEDPHYYLSQHDIIVVDPQKLQHLNDQSYFTEEQKLALTSAMYLNYEGTNALEHDVDALTWILRRRRGHRGRDILRAKHVLLTRNERLAKAGVKIVRENCGYSNIDAGPALLARDLAGLLWLLVGQSDRNQLSRRQLILSCERARSAAPEIVMKMYETLKSINPANADLLWTTVQKPRYLDMTLDAVIAAGGHISAETVDETLARIREDLIAAERQKMDEELQKHKERSEVEANLLKIASVSLQSENQRLIDKNSEMKAQKYETSKSIWEEFSGGANILFWLILVVFHLVTISGMFFASYVGSDLFIHSDVVKFLISSAVSLFSFYFGLMSGTSKVRTALERIMRWRYVNRLKSLRLMDAESDDIIVKDDMIKAMNFWSTQKSAKTLTSE